MDYKQYESGNKSKIEFRSLKEVKDELQENSPDKLVFWIGSGIDSAAPACLPLGNELAQHILYMACGKYAEKLTKVWKENCNIIRSVSNAYIYLSEYPRLETVIEIVREFETHQKEKQSVLEGPRFFHQPVFLQTMNTIFWYTICTKEQILLLQIMEILFPGLMRTNMAQVKFRMNIKTCIYEVSNKWSSCIYHIHCISEDLDTIGANLSNVKQSLPSMIENKIRDSEKIEWAILTSLNCHTEAFFIRLLECPPAIKRKVRSISKQENIHILIRCYKLIISGGYDCVVNENQIY